jgi:hypothetical protein
MVRSANCIIDTRFEGYCYQCKQQGHKADACQNQNKTTDNNEDIEQSGARFKETVETVASKVIVRKEAVGSNKRTRAKDLKDTRCQTKWLI